MEVHVLIVIASVAHAVPVGDTTMTPVAQGPHHAHALEYGSARAASAPPPRGTLPEVVGRPDMTVYGYLAYWSNDLATVPWAEITHLALFSAEATSSGSLDRTERWDLVDDAVAMAEPYGVRVHLCVTNFDSGSLSKLLGNPVSRATLLDELEGWVTSTGAHGVNIDFEGMPATQRDNMVDFTEELAERVPEVVLATPAVDWSNAWDHGALTRHAQLFLMGYDYHWGGSSHAGPIDPLFAGEGTVWDGVNGHSLSRSIADYLSAGADPEQIILGLPLYGRRWDTSSDQVPAPAVAAGSTVLFRDAWSGAELNGRQFEADAQSPWFHDGSGQTWYGDEQSVRARIVHVRDQTPFAGVGFWALHYTDDAAFWGMVAQESRAPTIASEPTPFVANAGKPFLAYVGDTVELSAVASTGPEGVELQVRWTQRSGPTVRLRRPGSTTPRFVVEQVGNIVFELEVGDGEVWSPPAESHVVVIDPDAARRQVGGCGCAGGVGPIGWLWLPALLMLRYRHEGEPSKASGR